MAYQVEITKRAKREIRHLPPDARPRIAAEIRSLAEDPRPRGSEKLSVSDSYRVRAGDYRIIYRIQDDALVVLIIRVGHRREVYREF